MGIASRINREWLETTLCGHSPSHFERLFLPHKRHSAETLLDHRVGHVEDARRDSEAERLGGVDGVNVSFGEPLDVEES
jgi:hypothetical protein